MIIRNLAFPGIECFLVLWLIFFLLCKPSSLSLLSLFPALAYHNFLFDPWFLLDSISVITGILGKNTMPSRSLNSDVSCLGQL